MPIAPASALGKELTEAQRQRLYGYTHSWRRAREKTKRVYNARRYPDFTKDPWAATRCLQHELASMPREVRARGLQRLPENVRSRLQMFMEAGLHHQQCALQAIQNRGYVTEPADETQEEPEDSDQSEIADGAEVATTQKFGIHGISFCKRDRLYRICVSLQLNLYVDATTRTLEEAICVHAALLDAATACRLCDSTGTLVAAVDACKKDLYAGDLDPTVGKPTLYFWAVAQIGRKRGARVTLRSPRTVTVVEALHWRLRLRDAFEAEGPDCPSALLQCFERKQYGAEEAHARANRFWQIAFRLREGQRERSLDKTLGRIVPAVRAELSAERARARAQAAIKRRKHRIGDEHRCESSARPKCLNLGPCQQKAFKHLTTAEIMHRTSAPNRG